MKIEAGGQYKNRGGRRVVCVERRERDGKWVVCDSDSCVSLAVNDDGRHCSKLDCDYDLIDEWTEPATKEVTVYLYRAPNGYVERCIDSSHVPAHWTIIARKTVTLTEGEGMA